MGRRVDVLFVNHGATRRVIGPAGDIGGMPSEMYEETGGYIPGRCSAWVRSVSWHHPESDLSPRQQSMGRSTYLLSTSQNVVDVLYSRRVDVTDANTCVP